MGQVPVDELIDALQAEFDEARWPVLVSSLDDAAERVRSRFTAEQMEALFGPETEQRTGRPIVDTRPLTHEALGELVAAFGLPGRLATRACWGLALVPGGTGDRACGSA